MLLDVARTQKWIDALEANGHRQIRGILRDFDGNVCAVGCISEVDHTIWGSADRFMVRLLNHIVRLNDGSIYNHTQPHTFPQIANILKIRLRAQQEFMGVITEKEKQKELTNAH